MCEVLKKDIAKKLTEEHGKDLLNLEKCTQILESLRKEKVAIENKLDINSEDSHIRKSLTTAEDEITKCDEVIRCSKECVAEIEDNLNTVNDVRRKLEDSFQDLYMLQSSLQYLKVIQKIEFLNEELRREFIKKDDEQCATVFVNLCEIFRHLVDFRGVHLRNHLKDTICYWYEVLKEKFAKDFEEILAAIKWPFVNANFSLVIPSQTNISKLQVVTEYLLQIELPPEILSPDRTSTGLLSDFRPLSLPIQLLIVPLKKRFLYHFYGARKTNRTDKPEWYFTQVLTWVRDHQDFVEKWIQPVVNKLGLHHIDARLELTRGLVQLAVEKLYSDIPKIQYDDFTFSHSIDEALGFNKELKETYDYPSSQPGVFSVLTQAQIFNKWLNMEKKYATEKMDTILPPSSLDAFEPLTTEFEDFMVTVCADAFILLLQTITERYECLPQPGHRLQFLELQLELLDDFRVRLVQLAHAEQGDVIESKIPAIINTLFYIEFILNDWGVTLHFLNLFYYKSQLEKIKANTSFNDFDDLPTNDLENESVFCDTLSLYAHLRKELLNTLIDAVMLEVKSRSSKYCNEWWSNMVCLKDFKSYSLTPTACPMFEVLSKRLFQLQKYLANKLFSITWKSIARQIDTYLFEELVLDNKFNEGGAMQLKYDVTRNLLPLFSQYTERPAVYFSQLVESCNLLCLAKGSAMLLRETLLAFEGATGIEDNRGRALQEVGVKDFSPKLAIKLLNRRTDITADRIAID